MIFPFSNLILFLVTLLSGVGAYYFRSRNDHAVKLLLAFSGAFLLSTCFIHLLPEIFENKTVNSAPLILGGFFLQLLIEYFSKGVEHGHMHESPQVKSFPYLIYIGLCIHAFMEGLPLAAEASNPEFFRPLYWGILLHNIPISIILISLFSAYGLGRTKVIIAMAFFSALAPFAAFTGHSVVAVTSADTLIYFLAISTGIFLHISTVILFESSKNHKFNLMKFAFIVAGGLLSFFVF